MIFTPDKAKQFLPLLKDLADGVVLERRDTSLGWGITTAIDTQEDPARYRRKPEPRERWVVTRTHNAEAVFETRLAALGYKAVYGGVLSQYREVV